MRRLLCLCVAVLLLSVPASYGTSSVTQQKGEDEVLAQGNPSLTFGLVDRLVEFFEWTFEAKFTRTQRTVFVSKLLQVWEKRDQKAIDAFVDVRKRFDELAKATKAERDEAQKQVQTVLLDAFRNSPPDSVGDFLVSVYASAHPDAGERLKSPPSAGNTTAAITRIPSELVGEWIARRGSGTSYSNPNTGQYSAPNATIDNYKIFADGTYEHAMLMQSSLYNCTTTIVGRETGPITVQGATFTITPRPGTLDYKSSCSPSLNSLKQTNFDPQTFNWRLERNEYGLQLCLQRTDGVSGCYQKQ